VPHRDGGRGEGGGAQASVRPGGKQSGKQKGNHPRSSDRQALSLQPDEYLRMLAAGLLAVQFYGLQTGATRIRVNKIPPQLAGFFQALGYRLETRKRLLYAVRDTEAPTTH
jgi:hypothetical protein